MSYFIVNRLAKLMVENKLSEKSKAIRYTIFWLIISLLTIPFTNISPTTLKICISLIGLVIMGFGSMYLFGLNSKGDGKNFIERVILLSLPINIEMNILIAIMGLISIIFLNVIKITSFSNLYILSILEICGLIYYFFRMKKYLQIVSTANRA